MGVAPDGAAALALYEASAAQGYPPAHFNLGVLFGRGADGLEADLARARLSFEAAAALDYAPAMAALGTMIFSYGAETEYPEAIDYLKRAVELGDPGAHEWLAHVYYSGLGVAEDRAEARRLYEVAALMGGASAQVSAAIMMADGEGGSVDPARAADFLDRAVAQRHPRGLAERGLFELDHPELGASRLAAYADCLAGHRLMGAAGTTCQERGQLSPEELENGAAMADKIVAAWSDSD